MKTLTINLEKMVCRPLSDAIYNDCTFVNCSMSFTKAELDCTWENATIDTVDKCVRIALDQAETEKQRQYYIAHQRRTYNSFYKKPAEGFDVWVRKMLWCSDEIAKGEIQFYLLKEQMKLITTTITQDLFDTTLELWKHFVYHRDNCIPVDNYLKELAIYHDTTEDIIRFFLNKQIEKTFLEHSYEASITKNHRGKNELNIIPKQRA